MSDASIDVVRNQVARMFAGSPMAAYDAMQISNMRCADLFDYHAKRLPG
jgi:hypothetical protein